MSTLIAVARHSATDPALLPAGAVPYEPLPSYTRWWADVESCAGRIAVRKARVGWYEVANSTAFEIRGEEAHGAWRRRGPTIIIAGNVIGNAGIVRHEVLNTGEHPADYFEQKCGSLLAGSE